LLFPEDETPSHLPPPHVGRLGLPFPFCATSSHCSPSLSFLRAYFARLLRSLPPYSPGLRRLYAFLMCFSFFFRRGFLFSRHDPLRSSRALTVSTFFFVSFKIRLVPLSRIVQYPCTLFFVPYSLPTSLHCLRFLFFSPPAIPRPLLWPLISGRKPAFPFPFFPFVLSSFFFQYRSNFLPPHNVSSERYGLAFTSPCFCNPRDAVIFFLLNLPLLSPGFSTGFFFVNALSRLRS